MKVKSGDVVEFKALQWYDENWEFDFPSIISEPILIYSPNGESIESLLEDACMDACISGELETQDDEDDTFDGYTLKHIKRVIKSRLNGKDDWKSKSAKAFSIKVKFFTNEENELDFETVEEIEK